MTFSTPVTPTRDSETWTVGSCDCTSGEVIVMERASDTEKTRVATRGHRPSLMRIVCYHSPIGWKPQCSAPCDFKSPSRSVGDIAEERDVVLRNGDPRCEVEDSGAA